MRWFLPQSLPVWVLLIVIAGLLTSQISTLSIVSRDRVASNDVVDLYRLNDRAFSLAQLMYAATPEERKVTAAGLFGRQLRTHRFGHTRGHVVDCGR